MFIYVKTGLEGETFSAPSDAVTLTQAACMYQLSGVNEEFNVGQRAGQQVTFEAGKNRPIALTFSPT